LKNSLIKNIAALSSLQMAALVLPLLTIPFLTRVLGVEVWGRVIFVQIVLSYFCQVTSWGFGWSGTRKVSALRDRPDELSRILVTTWFAQFLLAIAVFLVLGLLINFIPFFQKDVLLYVAGMGLIIGNVLFPIWFLNGLERMTESATIQIMARITVVLMTFAFIKSPADAALLLWINALGSIIPGALCLWWLRRNFKIRWLDFSFRAAWFEIREAASIFLSTLAISFYTTAIPIALGVISGSSAVAYYSLADRARQAAQAALAPISQALFPRMSHLFVTDKISAVKLLKKSGFLILVFSALLSISLWVFAPIIVNILGGEAFESASSLLRWLSVLPFVVSLSNIFGVQIMLPNNENKAFNVILGVAGILSLVFMVPVISLEGSTGAVLIMVATELGVTLAMAAYLIRKGYFSGRFQRSESNAS